MSVRVDSLGFAYDDRPVLEDISLEVATGETLALLGPNGSGKTTLLRNLSGTLGGPAQRERVVLAGKSLRSLRARDVARLLAAVEAEVRTHFDFTVREVVELGRIPHLNRLQTLRPADRRAVDWAIEVTRLEQFVERPLSGLSSGERQRVWLALALAQEPRILLLDEPTAHLDLRHQVETLELVRSLAAQGLTVIYSVHDLNLAVRYADRIALLARGRLVVDGPPETALTEERLESVYGTPVRILREPDGSVEAILPGRRSVGRGGGRPAR